MQIDSLNVGDEVYSVSMGAGKVLSVSPNSVMIAHNGNPWRYNASLIRSGCKYSDLVRSADQVLLNADTSDKQKIACAAEIMNVVEKYYYANFDK